MAIELIPLLEEESGPDIPPGPFVPPTATSYQEVADTVASYLDYNSPTRRDSSLAYMAWDVASDVLSAFRSAGDALKKGLGATWSAVESGWEALGEGVAAVHFTVDTIQSALGHTAGEPTVVEQLETIAAGGGNSWWGTVPFDPTDTQWVLVGTDTFTDAIHFDEEGHVYLITAIAPFSSRSEEVIDTETVYFGLGWWAEMAGDYRSERSYLDFERNIAHREGHLMRGCLVNFPKGGDGQISAYKYTPT